MSDTEVTCRNIFFIVGSGRCGTTLLRSMFSAHSEICIPTETHFYNVFRPMSIARSGPMRAGVYPKILDRIDRWKHVQGEVVDWDHFYKLARPMSPEWRSILTAFLTTYRLGQGKSMVGDKTPGHVSWLTKIARDYPDAKFVHLVRDPRAVVHSHLGHPSYRSVYGDRIGYAAWKWRRAVEKAAKARRGLPPDRLIEIRYENLIEAPEPTMRSLCEFLNVPFEAQMLDDRTGQGVFIRNSDTHHLATAPITSARRDVWSSTLDARQVAIIETIVGQRRMASLGYEPVTAPSGGLSGVATFGRSVGQLASGAFCAARHGARKIVSM